MSYQIRLTPDAEDQLRALPAHVRPPARQIIKDLADEPRPARSKELRGKPGVYRVWLAGRWRIVYAVDDEDQLVIVLRIRRKDQIDYDNI